MFEEGRGREGGREGGSLSQPLFLPLLLRTSDTTRVQSLNEKERKKRGMWDRCDIALHAAQSLATGCGGSVVEFLDALVIDEVSYSSRGTATCKACPPATSL